MKRFFFLLSLALCIASIAEAQTFTQHLQKTQPGKANVTVKQSHEIEELVNNANVSARKQDQANKPAANPQTPKQNNNTPIKKQNDHKVNGYRVQVFAGGNSRNDKIKAQNAGNAVKQAFPSQPVYVHFYSPRWICRVGNFRTYEEANAILHQVKKMGYKQACIVSGKINVAY